MRPSGSATEHAPIHGVSEHSGASQVATEHNVTDQGTSDVNDTEYDDGPIRPCAICGTELPDDPPPQECRATEHTSASSLCAQPDSDSTSVVRVNVKSLVGLSPKPEEIRMVELDRDATVGQLKNRLQMQLMASHIRPNLVQHHMPTCLQHRSLSPSNKGCYSTPFGMLVGPTIATEPKGL